jgi:hypothetical protein
MLDHRTAAAASAPHAARRVAGSFLTLVLADGSRAFLLSFTVHGRRTRVVLHERPDCTCGCGGGWNAHLAHAELLRLRVQSRKPYEGTA